MKKFLITTILTLAGLFTLAGDSLARCCGHGHWRHGHGHRWHLLHRR